MVPTVAWQMVIATRPAPWASSPADDDDLDGARLRCWRQLDAGDGDFDIDESAAALTRWRDSDVDEQDAPDDLQLLAQLRAGDLAASDPSPCPASGRICRGQDGARTAMDFGGATA